MRAIARGRLRPVALPVPGRRPRRPVVPRTAVPALLLAVALLAGLAVWAWASDLTVLAALLLAALAVTVTLLSATRARDVRALVEAVDPSAEPILPVTPTATARPENRRTPAARKRQPNRARAKVLAEIDRRTRLTARTPAGRGRQPARPGAGLPVSSRVAHGAEPVRVSTSLYRHTLDVYGARAQLTRLRRDQDRSALLSRLRCRLVRFAPLLVVPAAAGYRVWRGTGLLPDAAGTTAGRVAIGCAVALTAGGMVWTLLATRGAPGRDARNGHGDTYMLRSTFAGEQLAVRLAAGVSPVQAWRTVAHRNHFAPDAAIPARTAQDAIALVAHLRRTSLRRRTPSARNLAAAVVAPLLVCLLPAAVLVLLV